MNKLQYLSYILDAETPTYGNRNKFICKKKSDISKGDTANDSSINTTVHIGTHIDMPYHFFHDGQSIEDFDIDYFQFSKVLFLTFTPEDVIVKNDLIKRLKEVKNKDSFDLLIVKTAICYERDKKSFWEKNYGFDPEIAHYLRDNFPQVRAMGFDSISVSSFTNRMLGRESHRAFLDPEQPILLIEDMDLTGLDELSKINKVQVVPLRIAKCDGLPCTIIAEVS